MRTLAVIALMGMTLVVQTSWASTIICNGRKMGAIITKSDGKTTVQVLNKEHKTSIWGRCGSRPFAAVYTQCNVPLSTDSGLNVTVRIGGQFGFEGEIRQWNMTGSKIIDLLTCAKF